MIELILIEQTKDRIFGFLIGGGFSNRFERSKCVYWTIYRDQAEQGYYLSPLMGFWDERHDWLDDIELEFEDEPFRDHFFTLGRTIVPLEILKHGLQSLPDAMFIWRPA